MGGCQVSVAASKLYGQVWRKIFESKDICLTELRTLGLLTSIEVAEVHASDFDQRNAMWVIHTVTELEVLRAVGFVERK